MRRPVILILIIIIIVGIVIYTKVDLSEWVSKSNFGSKAKAEDKPTPVQSSLPKPRELDKLENTDNSRSEQRTLINHNKDILILVNKQHSLPADYVPADLVKPKIPFPFSEDLPKKLMRQEAATALEALFKKAKLDEIEIVGISGYRSYQRQKEIFNYNANRVGKEIANKTSAYPGQSEHQTGLAMDVTNSKMNYRLKEIFGQTKEGIWLAKNAADFGFIIRYPKGKEAITGYNYEPWHLRYVGIKAAQEISRRNITLEEYLGK